jgi:hypothetical protein
MTFSDMFQIFRDFKLPPWCWWVRSSVCYAASSGNPLPTFRDNLSVPSPRVKKSKKKPPSGNSLLTFRNNVSVPCSRVKKSNKTALFWISWSFKMGPIRCPETSVKWYHSTLRNITEEHRSLSDFHNISYLQTIWGNYLKKIAIYKLCKFLSSLGACKDDEDIFFLFLAKLNSVYVSAHKNMCMYWQFPATL